MISLTSKPERIMDGEILSMKLEINGKVNNQMYLGKYFNLVIKKNGSISAKPETLYPQRYNLVPLVWEINQNSYISAGTFNVFATIQDGPIVSTGTFIVDEITIVNKIDTSNNISSMINTQNIKTKYKKTQEQIPDYTGNCSIQKPGQILLEPVKKEVLDDSNNKGVTSYLVSSNSVQIHSKNVNSR